MDVLKKYRHVVATLNHFESYIVMEYDLTLLEFLLLSELYLESKTWTSLLYNYNLSAGKLSSTLNALRARKMVTVDATRKHFRYTGAKYITVTEKAKKTIETIYTVNLVPTFILQE